MASCWRLEGRIATFKSAALGGELHIARPQDGLYGLTRSGESISGVLFKALLEPIGAQGDEEPIDFYARLGDIVATYPQTPKRPFRPQVCWRIVEEAATEGFAEVVASVQTSLLDSNPQVELQSTLPASDVLRLIDAQTGQFEQLPPHAGAEMLTPDLPACFLYRPRAGADSYVEMVPPSDVGELSLLRDPDDTVTLGNRLFTRSLEKGVILRARHRGLFVARDNDIQLAATAYAALLNSRLPLTT
jgi:hypothetical protein